MNYIISGIGTLKGSILTGTIVYLIIFLGLFLWKRSRRKLAWKNLAELVFCIYAVTLLQTVGIFSLRFSWDGRYSYNLLPFVGSSFVPVLLNYLLFLPYGFLLPLVFVSGKWTTRKIVLWGAMTSLLIELLQMFGGRYAEIDDFLINTFGTYSGYILLECIQKCRKSPRKAAVSALKLATAFVICFGVIFAVGANDPELPDGLSAVESSISDVSIFYGEKTQQISVESELYSNFAILLSNCGGHIFEIRSISEPEIGNTADCCIEITFSAPQRITFQNAPDLILSDTGKILYNADKNILYWGNSAYQYCVDLTLLDAVLSEHREDILKQYNAFRDKILDRFQTIESVD